MNTNDFVRVIEILLPKPSPFPLIRIGGTADGAYLVPDDLSEIRGCFSPGVNNFKSFEDELVSKYGIPCHLCDPSSDPANFRTPLIEEMQTFKKAWLKGQSGADSISLSDWVFELAPTQDHDLMIQMDIEGGEYECLLAADESLLRRFRIVVLELHRLSGAKDPRSFEVQLEPLLRKIDRIFVCVHAHPNNCCGDYLLPGTEFRIPNVLEVTFLRRDRFYLSNNIKRYLPMLPHPLDISRNVQSLPPLFLNDAWRTVPQKKASRIKELLDRLDYTEARVVELTKLEGTLDRVFQNWCNSSTFIKPLEYGTNRGSDISVEELAEGQPFSLSSNYPGWPLQGRVICKFPFFFHTGFGANQGITIDLGSDAIIESISTTNRTDMCFERARFLCYEAHVGPKPTFQLGMPLLVNYAANSANNPASTIVPRLKARYVTIFNPADTAVHLSSIKVFGRRLSNNGIINHVTNTSPRRKFVVTKGVQGWGDRLQCLLQAIRYAKSTGRSLVIDWRDSDWTHNPEDPVERWFTLEDVDTTPLEKFLSVYREQSAIMQVVPPAWREHLADPAYSHWIYHPEYHHTPDQGLIEKICQGAQDFDEDIVVYAGVGSRTFSYSDCKKIQLSPWLRNRILSEAEALGLCTVSFDVIHLRGGSKSWAGGTVPLKMLNEKIHHTWPTQASYLKDLHLKYQDLINNQPSQELIIITDTKNLGTAWIDKYRRGRMIPTFNECLAESGSHKIKAKQLAEIGITKEQLNVEMLRDFCIMLNARYVVSDEISVFSKMAVRCNRAGVRLVDFSKSRSIVE